MLNRRRFLQIAGTTGAAAWGGFQISAGGDGIPERPNIVWLSCEDISPHLGCYGCADAITPTLDQLARKGVRFDAAFATAPVCAPNRSCIITGVYAAALGSHHMRSGGEGDAGSPRPKLAEEVVPLPVLLRQAGYYCSNNSKEDYNFEVNAPLWDESGKNAHWRNRPHPEQPFFSVFNFTDTHESQVRAEARVVERNTRMLTPEQRRRPEHLAIPPYHADTPDTRRNWANYHELITALDYWAAEMLSQLKQDGLAENTIVVFWSDHGHGLPRGKRWLWDSGTRIPLIAYAPPKWQAFSGVTPGTVDERLVSCVDLAPSMLRLAGAAVPEFMQGQAFLGPDQSAPRQYVFATRDRMDERYDMIRMIRDKEHLYVRNYRPDLPYNQFLDYAEQSPVKQDLNRLAAEGGLPEGAAWVTAKTKPVEELYDVVKDPHNVHNLADEPEMQATLQRMRNAHETRMTEIRDLGLIPEPELVELGKQHGTRFNIYDGLEREHPGFWEELRRTAEAAGRMHPENMETLKQALNSPHPAMRWWAIIGIRRDPALDHLLRDALKDASPATAIAAAHGLMLREEPDPSAMELLVRSMQANNEWVRLMAIQALDEAGEKAHAVIDVLQEASKDNANKYVARVAEHALNAFAAAQ